jgi:hypothetical protein
LWIEPESRAQWAKEIEMSKPAETAINWGQIEALHGASPEQIKAEVHDVQVFRARSIEFDHRKAEALSVSYPTEPIELIRVLMSRGHLAEGWQRLEEMQRQQPHLRQDPEIKLELTRLYAFHARWEDAAHEASETLAIALTPSTRMVALQSRSIARFELGRMREAQVDIEQIRSLGKLYPRASALLYAEILAARILAIEGDAHGARTLLAQIWSRILKEDRFNADALLTLMRAEGHIAMAAKLPARAFILAAHLLSELIGDEQYAALARMELFSSGDRSKQLVRRLAEDRSRFARVDQLLREIESGSPNSSSAKALAHASENSPRSYENFGSIEQIFIPARQILVTLPEWKLDSINKVTRPLEALQALGRHASLSKAELFRELFGEQKYVAHLHDPLLYQTLSRLRRQWNVEVQTVEGRLSTPRLLLIEVAS